MLPIQGLKCIYDTAGRGWSIELALKAESEVLLRRFAVEGREDAKMLVEAFEGSVLCEFDPETGEIVFGYEYLDLYAADDEEEMAEDDEDDEDEDEDDSDEDDPRGYGKANS